MDTLYYFLSLVAGLAIFLGVAGVIAWGVMWAADWYFSADEHPVHRPAMRERGYDTCAHCGERVLPENVYYGVCKDCRDDLDARAAALLHEMVRVAPHPDDCAYCQAGEPMNHAYEAPVTHDEWVALMHAIDEANAEQEDHR